LVEENRMTKPSSLLGKESPLFRRHPLVFVVCGWVAAFGDLSRARAQDVSVPTVPGPTSIPAPPPPVELFPAAPSPTEPPSMPPSHLDIGNQEFDMSVGGMRKYLETIRPARPDVYAHLSPDLERLESRADTAHVILAMGAALGLASGIVGLVARKDCPLPMVSDRAFLAKSAAWDACNQYNERTTATLSILGLALFAGGALSSIAQAPHRSDLLELVNKHNRLNIAPLQLQMGYDPGRRLTFGGATLKF
jgi:hypothetical protein